MNMFYAVKSEEMLEAISYGDSLIFYMIEKLGWWPFRKWAAKEVGARVPGIFANIRYTRYSKRRHAVEQCRLWRLKRISEIR